MAFAALALITLPFKVQAQFTGKAAATTQFESNSNVFDINTGAPLPVGVANTVRSDTYYSYGARFDLDYLMGRQRFFASAGTTEFNYQRHTQLDHDDYRLDAGLNWTLTSLLNGKIDVTRTRSMVPFYDLGGTSLSLETLQREEAEADYLISPEWRLEGDAYTSKLDEPLPDTPDLSLTETSGKVTVRYLGITRFTAGGFVSYSSGSYQGITGSTNPDYHQAATGIATTFRSPRSTYEGQLGYSRRTSTDGTDNTSGVTGQLRLREQLTEKTSATFEVGRSIQSYLLNTGSEIDSSAGLSAEWQATYKLAVSLGYMYTYRDYPGQGNNPVGSERVDIQSAAILRIDYRPRPWLSIKPYANLQWRISNYIGGEFNATIFGVSFTIQTPDKKAN
jgi:Putative beta-barrel porin 2